jgi:hypothetical protein
MSVPMTLAKQRIAKIRARLEAFSVPSSRQILPTMKFLLAQIADLESKLAASAERERRLQELETLLNTPEIEDFDKGVPLESAHQVLRWSAEHDAGKNPEDWFWLIGYLAGKALHAAKTGDLKKAKHHCISTSAALRNWHAHLRSGESAMRPGIAVPAALDETGGTK